MSLLWTVSLLRYSFITPIPFPPYSWAECRRLSERVIILKFRATSSVKEPVSGSDALHCVWELRINDIWLGLLGLLLLLANNFICKTANGKTKECCCTGCTRSPFLTWVSRRAQSGRWSSFDRRVWFTESHIVLVIYFIVVLFTQFILNIQKVSLYQVKETKSHFIKITLCVTCTLSLTEFS